MHCKAVIAGYDVVFRFNPWSFLGQHIQSFGLDRVASTQNTVPSVHPTANAVPWLMSIFKRSQQKFFQLPCGFQANTPASPEPGAVNDQIGQASWRERDTRSFEWTAANSSSLSFLFHAPFFTGLFSFLATIEGIGFSSLFWVVSSAITVRYDYGARYKNKDNWQSSRLCVNYYPCDEPFEYLCSKQRISSLKARPLYRMPHHFSHPKLSTFPAESAVVTPFPHCLRVRLKKNITAFPERIFSILDGGTKLEIAWKLHASCSAQFRCGLGIFLCNSRLIICRQQGFLANPGWSLLNYLIWVRVASTYEIACSSSACVRAISIAIS